MYNLQKRHAIIKNTLNSHYNSTQRTMRWNIQIRERLQHIAFRMLHSVSVS